MKRTLTFTVIYELEWDGRRPLALEEMIEDIEEDAAYECMGGGASGPYRYKRLSCERTAD